MVARQAMRLVLPGLFVGLGAAFLLMPLIGAPAFDFVVPHDPLVFGAATLVVCIVVTAASAIPALRASRIDPVVALRTE
jgi:putative ABC transport system permease protein